MANIKGITIEIGGNTSKLESALKNVNKVIYSTNSELKDLNRALKLDPKNTELLAQKQDVLKQNIKATTDRLNTLKEAQKQMGSYSSLTEEQKEKYRALSVEISKGESALKGMQTQLKETSRINLDGLKDGLGKVGDVALDVSKKMLKVTGAVAGALAGVVGAGVKSYADYEQNLGGVETMFGKHADKVVQNAKNAYKTAGVSANEYMEGVTSFSASLLQSLGGDTNKAADVADMAFRDMSDNANKFGTDMASIQYAYQGFAKQNYTMLDNLKLGYGGTKTEMERLLADAEKLTGKKYDIQNLNDVYEAIHAIQGKLGVTGTTAEEAEKTISGSVASMKASFDNFLNGSGSASDLAETVTNVLTNISNAIIKLAPDILSGIVQLIETLLPQVAKILIDLVPQLLDAVGNMIDALLNMVSKDMSGVQKVITELINAIVTFVTTNLPKILELGLKLIIALAQGLAESLPQLIPVIVQCITAIYETLLNNLSMIIEVAIQIILALVQGITNALPILIAKIPEIIQKIVQVLIENLPLLVDAAIQIIFALIQGLITAIPQLVMAIPKITMAIIKGLISALPKFVENGGKMVASIIRGIGGNISVLGNTAKRIKDTIIDKIKSLPRDMLNWGKDMVMGLANGIKNAIGHVTGAVKSVANKIKSFLHFSRPDVGPLREYEVWMPDMIKGMAKGIKKSSYLLENATDNMAKNMAEKLSIGNIFKDTTDAMKTLSYGINTSLNPMINPNANALMLEKQNNNNFSDSKDNKESFTAIINNNSKYTSPAENIRLLRKEHELYKLKYGGVK